MSTIQVSRYWRRANSKQIFVNSPFPGYYIETDSAHSVIMKSNLYSTNLIIIKIYDNFYL